MCFKFYLCAGELKVISFLGVVALRLVVPELLAGQTVQSHFDLTIGEGQGRKRN